VTPVHVKLALKPAPHGPASSTPAVGLEKTVIAPSDGDEKKDTEDCLF